MLTSVWKRPRDVLIPHSLHFYQALLQKLDSEQESTWGRSVTGGPSLFLSLYSPPQARSRKSLPFSPQALCCPLSLFSARLSGNCQQPQKPIQVLGRKPVCLTSCTEPGRFPSWAAEYNRWADGCLLAVFLSIALMTPWQTGA